MAFLETPRFPDNIDYGSSGGPMFNTTVISISNSSEYRNGNWDYPRQSYDVGYAIKTLAELQTVYDFFYTCLGKANGFRFKDPLDYKSCVHGDVIAATDQTIGTGDSSTLTYQLKKTYSKGAFLLERLIKRPVDSTVVLALDGKNIVGKTLGVKNFDPSHSIAITNVTNAVYPTFTFASPHGLSSTYSRIWLSGFTGEYASYNDAFYYVAWVSDTTIVINTQVSDDGDPPDTTAYTPYSSNGGLSRLVIPEEGWTVDGATGIVDFGANQNSNIKTGSYWVGQPLSFGDYYPDACYLSCYDPHGLEDGDWVYITGIVTVAGDWEALNDNWWQVSIEKQSSKNFEISTAQIDTSAFTNDFINQVPVGIAKLNTIPRTGEIITAGFEFDVPVRFDIDSLPMSHDNFEMGGMQIPLVELFNE